MSQESANIGRIAFLTAPTTQRGYKITPLTSTLHQSRTRIDKYSAFNEIGQDTSSNLNTMAQESNDVVDITLSTAPMTQGGVNITSLRATTTKSTTGVNKYSM